LVKCGALTFHCARVDGDTLQHAAFRGRCKRWECASCRRIKAAQIQAAIQRLWVRKQLWFLTLTFRRSASPLATWHRVGPSWNRLRSYFQRRGLRFSYVRIVEPHKSGGYPHLHVLVDRFLPAQALGKLLVGWGFGWQMRFVRVNSEGAGSYISKYVSKDWPDKHAYTLRREARTRVVSVSRSVGPLAPRSVGWILWASSLRWENVEASWERVYFALRQYLIVPPRVVRDVESCRLTCTIPHPPPGWLDDDCTFGTDAMVSAARTARAQIAFLSAGAEPAEFERYVSSARCGNA